MNDVQARISELEAELASETERANDNYDDVHKWRAKARGHAAVVEKARDMMKDDWRAQGYLGVLNAIPADLLREHDADVWDAAQTPVAIEPGTNPSTALPPNPYQVKPEDEWVDPEPWFYPATGVRTAHKLAQTNAEYRPRTVKPEDER